MELTPLKSYTFTIDKVPNRTASKKTLQRLMRMQPEIQKGLSRLAKRRRQIDNKPGIRAGVIWVNRAKTTKLTQVKPGESFTLKVTPQIMPDLNSVEKYVSVAEA